MARLPAIDSGAIEDPRIREGFEDEALAILAHKPIYVDLIRCVSRAISAETELDAELKQLVELKVARLHGCEYSVDLLEGGLIQRGVSQAKLHELDFYEESTLYEKRERLALQFAEQMALDAVDDALFHTVRQTFSIVETLELMVSVALETFYALVNRTLGLKSQGFRDQALAARGVAEAPEPRA